MKTGILGGTFNPVHNAHLSIAEASLDHCQLDRVLFLPAAIPPHKDVAEDVSFEQRFAMVEQAIDARSEFTASDLETKRSGASYSVDTLRELRHLYPEDEFYFIIGLDSFRDITTWKNYQQLFELANIIVASRPGPGDDDPLQLLPIAIRNQFCYDEKSLKLRHKSGRELIFINDTRFDISSTSIRENVAGGQSIASLVPASVADYIKENGLYRSTRKKI